MKKIKIVGMGPGDASLITLGTYRELISTPNLFLRTAIHPTVAQLDADGISYQALDHFYEEGTSFATVYQNIVSFLINTVKECSELIYAVPGSPLVAEQTVQLLLEQAGRHKIECDILPGMSFLEVLYQRLQMDPIKGVTIVDAEDIENYTPSSTSLVITQVYNATIASNLKLYLMDFYDDEQEIIYIHNLSLPDESIRTIPLYELDRQADIDHLTSVVIKNPHRKVFTGERFELAPLEETIRRLREPDGCPWDILQTHKSVRANLLEEVHEVIEAIDLEDDKLLCEELGDVLMQVVFHGRMAEQAGLFTMQDIIDGVNEKLIRRHPHVFGDMQLDDAAKVLDNWEKLKQQEKLERTSILDGVPKNLPALMQAYKLQKKASKVGFDWDKIDPVWKKCAEEIAELQEAISSGNTENIVEEYGDLLFALVNWARFLKVEPELALLQANRKFKQRFQYVEKRVHELNRDWKTFSLAELDEIWDESKQHDIH